MSINGRTEAALWGCIFVALAGGLAGCRATVPRAFGAREFSWGRSEPGRQPVPGIDEAHVHCGVWGDGVAVVLWSDGAGGSFGGGGMGGAPLQPGETRRGVKYEGRIASQDGRITHVRCYTSDGKSGTVTIGRETFELSRGGLFLVSVSGAEPKVKQLDLARLDMKPAGSRTLDEITRESLEELAMKDTEIRGFFAGAANSE